jgi:hypothetical protein
MAGEIAALRKARSNTGAPKLTKSHDVLARFDLTTPEGITVEVKSAAYVQSWHQHHLSAITFATPKTRVWDLDL